jgi:hypothetical protein
MARFPETEPDIAALATVMIPSPPVPPDALQESLDQYNATRTAAVAAESAARDHVALKNRALEQLADDMRLDLKYAEVTVKDAPDQLLKLGWGPRRDPRSLELPGVVRDLGIKSQGEGRVGGGRPRHRQRGAPDRPGGGCRAGVPRLRREQGRGR